MQKRFLFSALAVAFVLTAPAAQLAHAQTATAQPAAATTGDAAVAAKLKGQWTGRWEIGNFGGKFVLNVTEVEGTNLKGEGLWYGTANGDTKEPLAKASVKDGELVAEHPGGTKFKMKLQSDNTLEGSWELTGYSGPLTAKKQ